jgi:serine/threonine protein kinase/ABC-type phosphate/phosphonate transport system substrate-binding protein
MQHCAECGSGLPANVPPGLCPHCVLSDDLESASGEMPPLPRSFGDYELLEEIAKGGMGVVYRARQKSLDRIVAVKMLRSGFQADFDTIRRFRVEAVAAGSLKHPNIVPIHEVGEYDDRRFIVMDYVAGGNLAQFANQPLPPKRAAELLVTISSAIHYAHRHRILHRDLKPSNILMDYNGQPHVTDFGLAKGLETSLGEEGLEENHATVVLFQRHTADGEILGSPAYMPPEQADGRRGPVGRYSDIYSLGAMLYQLLTGRPPFEGASVADTLHRLLHDEVVSPRRLNASVPLDLETICLKCLEQDPARRYQTAQELAEELGRFLRDEPVLARSMRRPEKVWRWSRRNPAAAGLIAALLLILGVLCVLIKVLDDRRRGDLDAIASIRAMVVSNIEEMWQKPDKMTESISSEQLAALAGKRKRPAPVGALRLKLGMGATEAPVDRAREYEPMLDFMERRMERLLRRTVRLDLVLSKEVRMDKAVARDSLDLARIGALAFIRARQANPRLMPLAQENAPKDAVIWTPKRTGITNLNQVRSLAFADTNSTISAWAKVFLVRAGIRAANLSHHADLPSRVTELYAHREAVKAVLAGRFDAGVARPAHLNSEVGVEGRDWIALLKFDSSQTVWAAGGNMEDAVRDAFKTVLIELSKQQHLVLPDRVRDLIPIDTKLLLELEEALERDLKLFDSPAVPEVERGKL